MDRTVLVVGATGISGYHCAREFAKRGFRVLGLSRSRRYDIEGVEPIMADVLDVSSLERALTGRGITDLVYAAWLRQATEDENCRVNGAMLDNVLSVLGRDGALRHAVLITGLKYYLGPFEAYAKQPPETPFREDQDRLPFQNFYYVQEDILASRAAEFGFTWSVHRPHTLIGFALGNAMNMGVTLAVYGTICRFTGEPFVFPGSPAQWNGVTDITDARLLGRHVVWSATEPAAMNQAFNTVNGDVFRWRYMWPKLATALGVEPAEYPGKETPLQGRMDHADRVWSTVVREHDLKPYSATTLASWWHTDADLCRPVEAFASMNKSRALGFLDHQDSVQSFVDLFATLRAERIIPSATH